MPEDSLTLTVDGHDYAGWTRIRLTRAIDRMVTDFDIEVTERWAGQDQAWQITPFSPCTVSLGKDLVLTGYVDDYLPTFDAQQHRVRITGRSRTEDIIDCTPNLRDGQFNGYKLDQIARAIAGLFKVDVVVQADVGEPFTDTSMYRHEDGFQFLERLARLRSVLLTDDEKGRLILTTAGTSKSSGSIVQGVNILRASGRLSASKRFSEYHVVGMSGEAGSAGGVPGWDVVPVGGQAVQRSAVPQAKVKTDVEAVAYDKNVPRFRPTVIMGETHMDATRARKRADWQMRYHAARAVQIRVWVQGWRQPDGTPWRINQLVPVKAPYVQLDRELLCASVTYHLDDHMGRVTEMILGPVEGYAADPGQVRVRRNRRGRGHKGRGGGGDWSGVNAIGGG